MDQNDVIAFLSNPASYNGLRGGIERHQTHGAIVFLAGGLAYKLKRAVRFPYMDYSTQERRRAACEAELAVNRRAAPSLYLGVRAIVRGTDGELQFGDNDNPHAVDWVVVMRRFPQTALLEQIRKRGDLTDTIVRRLAEVVADFHAQAEVARDLGGAAHMRDVIEGNIRMLKSFEEKPFSRKAITAYDELSRNALKAVAARLDARRDTGFVRHCHGDLHLNNVCMIDGEPVLFDAIEFSEEFSNIDVFYDLAFLLMDLNHAGERKFANVLLNRYLELTFDFDGLAPLPLFLSCRAGVRAHVTAAQTGNSRNDEIDHAALSYLEDATRVLGPAAPKLIVLGGVSGTGKSTCGRALAPLIGVAAGAVVLRSDVLRKSLWGVHKDTALPEAAYAAEVTSKIYEMLNSRAADILAAGHSVIVDAVYGNASERQGIADVARKVHFPFYGIWLDAPVTTLEHRVAARRNDVSDATVAVLRRQVATIVPPADWIRVDAGGTAENTLRHACTALRLQPE